MQISHDQIAFSWKQNKKQIQLKNNTESIFIFKIKTTDFHQLKATPRRGFIEPKQFSSIKIECVVNQIQIEAKLQLSWARTEEKSQKFDEVWGKINLQQFTQNVIPIKRKKQKLNNFDSIKEKQSKLEIKEQENYSVKSSSMSVYDNSQIQKSQGISIKNGESKKINDKVLKSVAAQLKEANASKQVDKKQIKFKKTTETQIKQDGLLKYQSESVNYLLNHHHQSGTLKDGFSERNLSGSHLGLKQSIMRSMGMEQMSNLVFVQAQLLAEREQHQKLKEQVRRNKKIEAERKQMMIQYEINRSMTENRDSENLSWAVILLLGVIFFTAGVLLSRF